MENISSTPISHNKEIDILFHLHSNSTLTMGGEIYQAQVLRSFFDTITGTDRNLTRIYMCVLSLAKLRQEDPAMVSHLVEQVQKSKVKKELSVDILEYMCDVAREIDMTAVQTAFGVKEIKDMVQDFEGISLDSL